MQQLKAQKQPGMSVHKNYSKWSSFVPLHRKRSLVNPLLRRTYDIASSYQLVHTEFMNIKRMLSRNGYPNKFLDRDIQQFLNRKYGVTKQSDAPAEPSPSPKYISLQLPYLGSVSNNIRQEVNSFVRHKAVVNVKLRCFHSTQQLQSWFSIKDRQDLLNWFNVVYKPYVLMRCLLHQANAMKFNKSYRRASNVTKLFSMQTLASQPRSSGCLSQP